MRKLEAKTCAFWAVLAGLLSLNSQLQAQVTCTQIGSELFVAGTDGIDDIEIYVEPGQIQINSLIAPDQPPVQTWVFTGVSKVWVATGDGADNVYLVNFFADAEVDIDTGNDPDHVRCEVLEADFHALAIRTGDGDDEVILLIEGGVGFETLVDTGNGNDMVAVSGGGPVESAVSIVTGNGQDYVYLDLYYALQLAVQLGNGDDVVDGFVRGSSGTVDGGNGEDDCSGFFDNSGNINVINCEQ